MSKALEEITKDAIQLPRPQRLALASLLLELDNSSDDPEIALAWEQEIRARIAAIEDGTALGTAYEDVNSEAENRLGS